MAPGEALTRTRERFRRSPIHEAKDAAETLAASRDREFDPEHNLIDAAIARWLHGFHGQPLSEIGRTRSLYTEAERVELERLEGTVKGLTAEYHRAVDERIRVERLYYNPPPTTPVEQLVDLARRHRLAVEAQVQATRALEQAVAEVTALKMAAQSRRRSKAAGAKG